MIYILDLKLCSPDTKLVIALTPPRQPSRHYQPHRYLHCRSRLGEALLLNKQQTGGSLPVILDNHGLGDHRLLNKTAYELNLFICNCCSTI